MGDPLWNDLGVIFEGPSFGVAADTYDMDLNKPNAHDSPSVKQERGFDLDKQVVSANTFPTLPSRRASYHCTVLDSPDSHFNVGTYGSWNGVAYPLVQAPTKFVSPNAKSDSLASITEEEWNAARIASEERASAKKKIVFDFTLSPVSSSGSNRGVQVDRGSNSWAKVAPKFNKKPINKPKKSEE